MTVADFLISEIHLIYASYDDKVVEIDESTLTIPV